MAAFIFYVTLFTLMASTSRADTAQTSAAALLLRVDQSGKGDYEKIQDAIDAVPSNNKEVVFILVNPGIYHEKIVVPTDKPFITLSGSKPNDTVITGSDSGNIFESATFTVLASDFVGRYLTIQNTYGAGAKAVALRVSGDRVAFFGCRILSYQDTLLDDTGRHYYSNCHIEGAVDFIFGNAASLFERCHLHTLSEGDASITAQRRESPSEETGFTFLGCKITGVRTAVLGRPWGPYSRVIFALTYMSNVILPQGWDDWGDSSKQSTVFYREYKCYGPGANNRKRVEWSQQLTTKEAEIFLTKNLIGGKSWIRSTPKRFKKASSAISNNSTTH
ncbi:putative pectinesterase 11 [Gossypium raimondii]|uniref:putative pectinesterase 11 n=1 Tax=Gossypium raimondii TaxID=29730 RepID=UPI00063AAA13|nr:putative pectinesterase 11 [Gossypium raimondii]